MYFSQHNLLCLQILCLICASTYGPKFAGFEKGMVIIMKNNKILMVSLAMILSMGLISGCGNKAVESKATAKSKLSVVCTTFPSYDWTKEVMGEKAEDFDLTLLLDNGVDLHNYQPTAEDIAKIAECDLFIYVGGESDEWVEDALKEATNKDMRVINLMDALGSEVKEEELVEGMEEEEHEHEGEDAHDDEGGDVHDDEDEDAHDHEEAEEVEYDEHVWLSLKNAQALVEVIEGTLSEIDSKNAEIYKKNTDNYMTELKALDDEYETAVLSAKTNTVLFGDRFPFRYLVDDYGLDYYAAFVGCSAETEASFETITFLAGKVDELKLPTILVIENSDEKISEAIKSNTAGKDQKILVMNSLQSVTNSDIEAGFSYVSAMKDNLEILKQALN